MPSLLRPISLARSVKRVHRLARNPFLRPPYDPGHFYSPIPAQGDLDGHSAEQLGPKTFTVPGVALNVEGQLALLAELGRFAADQPFKEERTPGARYYYGTDVFSFQDAVMLYALLRHYRPRRVIEVGSGFSSASMLDVDERFLGQSVQFTFIEPYPDRLLELIRPAARERHQSLVKPVQDIPLDTFDELSANDILFIDSTHVGKVGSDVLFLLSEGLPRLKPGVLVHLHDIFWPFEYPEFWFAEGRAWNEAYLVRAFLQFNDRFVILLFNDYLRIHHAQAVRDTFPLARERSGASLWLMA